MEDERGGHVAVAACDVGAGGGERAVPRVGGVLRDVGHVHVEVLGYIQHGRTHRRRSGHYSKLKKTLTNYSSIIASGLPLNPATLISHFRGVDLHKEGHFEVARIEVWPHFREREFTVIASGLPLFLGHSHGILIRKNLL